MSSPFPGMDPYIEGWIWPAFHGSLAQSIHDQLNERLPRRFIASTDMYVWRVESADRLLVGAPDAFVTDKAPAPAVATLDAPVMSVLPGVVRRQRYVKVVDPAARRVVAVVEVLSPSNKTTGADGQAYRMKREEYIAEGISLVEIDLLRSGLRPPLGDPAPPLSDYYVLVHRGWEADRMGIWPVSVRDPLPTIPVPLDPGVPDVPIDLKACVDRVYAAGRYAEQLDYTKPPEPPLHEPDAAWARGLLAPQSPPT